MATSAPVRWPDSVDEILGGDQAVVLGHVTPARGVVLTPLTNFGVRDRASGTATPLNSSIGMWKKLERLQRDPRIAVAYHTRLHGFSERPEYVLMQGSASLTPLDDRGFLERHQAAWERFAGSRDVGPLWERWLEIYHWRIGIEVDVERLVVWPDLGCRGEPRTCGQPSPPEPPRSQDPPARGTGPRIDHARAAKRIRRLPDVLLGWVGADGFPTIVPVAVEAVAPDGLVVAAPDGVALPPGGRRAGLTAHWFARFNYGQRQRIHTGWLEVDGEGRAVYAPHTERGYALPASKLLYRVGAGLVTRRGFRSARSAGFIPEGAVR